MINSQRPIRQWTIAIITSIMFACGLMLPGVAPAQTDNSVGSSEFLRDGGVEEGANLSYVHLPLILQSSQSGSDPTPTPLPGGSTYTGTQGHVTEIALASSQNYSAVDAYTDVDVTARFTNPSGTTTIVRGFWDGERTWKIRFMPMEAGTWTIAINNNRDDAGLTQQATLQVDPADARGFLRRAQDVPQSFQFDNGERFFPLGQTYYEMVNNVRAGGGWKAAIAKSKEHGINKVRFLVHPWGDAQKTYPVSQPFINNDHDRLDLAHWQALDEIIHELNRQDMLADVILFADTPLAFGSQAQDERVLRYALARFAAFPNVTWCLTNEWEYTDKSPSYWDQMGGIVSAEDPFLRAPMGALRPVSIHNKTGGKNGGRFAFFGSDWPAHASIQYGVRSEYTPHADRWANDSILRNDDQGLPVINEEYGYIGETIKNSGKPYDRSAARSAIWAISVAGGYGSIGDWRADNKGTPVSVASNWRDAAEYDDLLRFKTFWSERGLRFWEFTERNGIVEGNRVYAGGAQSNDQIVVYAADGGKVSLDLPEGRTFAATRYDPRTGATQSLGSQSNDVRLDLPRGQDWVIEFIAQQ
jgi:hypothetical protein